MSFSQWPVLSCCSSLVQSHQLSGPVSLLAHDHQQKRTGWVFWLTWELGTEHSEIWCTMDRQNTANKKQRGFTQALVCAAKRKEHAAHAWAGIKTAKASDAQSREIKKGPTVLGPAGVSGEWKRERTSAAADGTGEGQARSLEEERIWIRLLVSIQGVCHSLVHEHKIQAKEVLHTHLRSTSYKTAYREGAPGKDKEKQLGEEVSG